MDLTLNDFRNILGKVNDGDAVFTKDNNGNTTGIEKANYGRLRTHNVKGVSADDSVMIREEFVAAIRRASGQNSPLVSEDTLKAIRTRLGIGEGEGPQADILNKPLSRREIKAILDIVDGSSEQMKVDDEILEKMHAGVDMEKRGQFERAVNASPILSGKDNLKSVIGKNFEGFARAQIARLVKKELALVKAMTLDEMTWHYTNTGEQLTIADAFKKAISKIMSNNAANKPTFTQTRLLFADAPAPAPFDDNEHNAEDFFRGNRLMPDGDLALLLTDDKEEGTDAFSKLVLSRAFGHVRNAFRADFQACITANGNVAQQAQESYDARTLGIRREIAELTNDVRNITSQNKENLAKFRHDLARKIAEAFRGIDLTKIDEWNFREVFMWALRKTVSPFSMRALAQKFADGSEHPEFANADFKAGFVEDFNKRVAALPADSAFKASIALWQAQAFNDVRGGNPLPEIGASLKHGTIEQLYRQFKTEREEADPEKLREKRVARNRDVAIRVLRSVDGDAKVDGYSPARLEDEIAGVQAKFYMSVHGYRSLKDAELNDIPDEERDARVSEWITAASDDEIAFLEKFCSIGLDKEDVDLQRKYYECTHNNMEKPPLYAAFRDAGSVFKDMTKDAARAIGTILETGLATLSTEGRPRIAFMSLMDNDKGRADTTANCLDFLEKLQREVDAHAGKHRELLTEADKQDIRKYEPTKSVESLFENTTYFDVVAFGTNDVLKTVKLLGQAGISLKDFSSADRGKWSETCVRLLALMHFAKANNYDLDSLPEFIQRVTGKDVKEVSFSDWLRFESTKASKRDVVPSGCEDAVKIVTGKVKFSEAKLSKDEVVGLRNALAAIRQPNAQPQSVTLKGKSLTIEMLADGGVRARLNAGGGKLYRFSQNALDLSRAVDDVIVANARDYDKAVVLSVLPPLPNPAKGDSLMRAREIYAKAICAFHPTKQVDGRESARSPVDYASVPTAELRRIAVDAIEGRAIPQLDARPQTFNSAEMIEMHKTLGNITLAEVDAKVKLPPDAAKRTEEYRRNVPPSPKEFRAIVADLFLNEDTWAFDAQAGAMPGDRIRKLMMSYSHELRFVFSDIGNFVKCLPREELPGGANAVGKVYLADKVAEILAKLKDIPAESLKPDAQGNVAADVQQKLAEAETLVDALVKSYADLMQAKVAKLFEVKDAGGAEKALQYQTFAEISGISALNPKTAEGKFTINVLKGYFTKSARVDQRAMLAAMLRNTDGASSDAKQVAELLKGAGPLLQKMLQGLPISSFNAETQLALKDMKSRLAPIPAEAVKAQLLELVNSSNGEILSVEVKQVLGAATVGEALLCHVKTKDCPVTGMDCVIKVLRPNIYTAALREKAILDEIIRETAPAMQKSFDLRYNEILKEFDLTLEAENIRLGRTHYEHPAIKGKVNVEINSMDLVANVSPATGTLVVKKVDGVTYDRYIDDIHAEAAGTVAHLAPKAVEMNGRVVRPCSSLNDLIFARRRLEYLKAFLGEKRNHISDFARTWFENGLYGDGFMHGDLHAGNIMISDRGATVIDFGNCIRMSAAEQDKIRTLVTKASIGYGEDAIKTFRELLGEDARKKLDAILENKANDPRNAAFKKDLYGVFTKGTAADVMARIYAAMNLIQREGVEIPGTVANFFQSFSRLNDIYQTMTDEMAHIDDLIDSLALGEDALPKITGKKPMLVKEFMDFVNGLASDPYKEFDYKKYAGAANKFIENKHWAIKDERGRCYGGKNNVGRACDSDGLAMNDLRNVLVNDRQRAIDTIVPFVEWLCEQRVPAEDISLLREGKVRGSNYVGKKRESIDVALLMIKLPDTFKTDSKEYGRAVDNLLEELPALLQSYAMQLAAIADPAPQNPTQEKFSGLAGVKETLDRPINMVCGEVVTEKLANFTALAKQFGVFIRDFTGRLDWVSAELRENIRFSGKFATRKAFAKSNLEVGNAALDENVRLTTAKRRILMRQMESFAWPFEGAWTKTLKKEDGDEVNKVKIGFPEVKWPLFVEALSENLKALKDALGFGEGENLPPEIAKLAVAYLAQIDPRCALAVKSLNEQDYNRFLLSVGQDPGSDVLRAAIGALRQAKGDAEIQSVRPSAVEEFNTIDGDADEVDISLAKLMKIAKNIGNYFGGDDDE